MQYHIIELNSKYGIISLLSSHDSYQEAFKAKKTRRSRFEQESVVPGLLSVILCQVLVNSYRKKSMAEVDKLFMYHIVGFVDGWFGLWGSQTNKSKATASLKGKQNGYKSKGYKFKLMEMPYSEMLKWVRIKNIKRRGLPYPPQDYMKFHVLTKTNNLVVLLGSYTTKEDAEKYGIKYFTKKGEHPLRLVEAKSRNAIIKRISKLNKPKDDVQKKERSTRKKRKGG